jgi:hypothetical protein
LYIYLVQNPQELKDLIRKNAALFWYIKDEDKENLPLPIVVEFFLNYASLDDVKELFRIVGIKKVAEIFYTLINTSERVANNILSINRNYFNLYFKKYA